MKNVFRILGLVLLIGFTISCEKREITPADENVTNFIGEWRLDNIEYKGVNYSACDTNLDNLDSLVISFKFNITSSTDAILNNICYNFDAPRTIEYDEITKVITFINRSKEVDVSYIVVDYISDSNSLKLKLIYSYNKSVATNVIYTYSK